MEYRIKQPVGGGGELECTEICLVEKKGGRKGNEMRVPVTLQKAHDFK